MSEATAVKERPIIFSGESVRAILDGSKTQTRRVIRMSYGRHRGQTPCDVKAHQAHVAAPSFWWGRFAEDPMWYSLPHYAIGDRLWVRERWAWLSWCYQGSYGYVPPDEPKWPPYYDGPGGQRYSVVHRAGTEPNAWGMTGEPRWRSPIFMPRTACRVTLEITDVRAERLNSISAADCIAEGVDDLPFDESSPYVEYRHAWDRINGRKYPWSGDPWVWAITFRRVEP